MLQLARLDDLLHQPAREVFESAWLPSYLVRQRWFGGKGRPLRAGRISRQWLSDALHEGPRILWLIVRVDYVEGPDEHYQLALTCEPCAFGETGDCILGGKPGRLVDALQNAAFITGWLKRLESQGLAVAALLDHGDRIEGETDTTLREWLTSPEGGADSVRPLRADQSNTAVLLGKAFFLKFYRRLEAGLSPEAEMVHYLGEACFDGTPAWRGELRLRPQGGEAVALALITDQVSEPVDAWSALQALLRGNMQPDFGLVEELGRRTAQMHLALAKGQTPAFLPEPFADSEPVRLAEAIAAEVETSLIHLRENLGALAPAEAAMAETLLANKARLLAPLAKLRECPARSLGLKIRTHGDFHLGQVLVHAGGVALLDFEGEPARSLAERRGKSSPLRDVAGMLRSLHYASVAARLLPLPAGGPTVAPTAEALAAWHAKAHATYLSSYLTAYLDASTPVVDPPTGGLLPDPDRFETLLEALLLEKASYELRYESQNRPDWAAIPLHGLIRLLRNDVTSP